MKKHMLPKYDMYEKKRFYPKLSNLEINSEEWDLLPSTDRKGPASKSRVYMDKLGETKPLNESRRKNII